jgi:PAS domain S-box-containing protein
MVPADRRDTYYPIQYVEPQEENGDIVGFDMASNPAINLTLEMVRDKGRIAVSSRVELNEFLYVSRGYETLWGNSCDNLYADPSAFSAAIHPSDRQRRLEALDRIRGGEASDMEYRVIHPNGSARWIRDSGFPVRNETGQIFRIVGVAEDITDRRLTDQALRESEGKLRTLFNYSPDIIMTVDRASRILMMNRPISELQAEHAIGQNSEV